MTFTDGAAGAILPRQGGQLPDCVCWSLVPSWLFRRASAGMCPFTRVPTTSASDEIGTIASVLVVMLRRLVCPHALDINWRASPHSGLHIGALRQCWRPVPRRPIQPAARTCPVPPDPTLSPHGTRPLDRSVGGRRRGCRSWHCGAGGANRLCVDPESSRRRRSTPALDDACAQNAQTEPDLRWYTDVPRSHAPGEHYQA